MKLTPRVVIVALAMCCAACAQVPTTPTGFYIPAHGTPNWDFYMNANFTRLDSMFTGLTVIPSINVSNTATFNNVVINGTCTGAGCGTGGGSAAGVPFDIQAAGPGSIFSADSGNIFMLPPQHIVEALGGFVSGTGTPGPGCTGGSGCISIGLGTDAGTPATGQAILQGFSSGNLLKLSLNGGAFSQVCTLASGCGASGTVTTFTAGNLSPLFTSSVATPTSTPALTFALSTFSADNIFGNFTGSSAAPSTQAIPSCAADGSHALTYASHTLGCTAIAGGVTSVFTRTGAITAQSGDYSVAQVTGAAPLASPTFTGTVTMPAPTLNNVTGSTQCLHVNTSGVVSGTGADCTPKTRSFTYEDVVKFQGSQPVWTGTQFSPGAVPTIDAVWGTGTSNFGTGTTLTLTSAMWRVPTGYGGSFPVTIIFHSPDTTHTATTQLQAFCVNATSVPVSPLSLASFSNVGATITLTPSGTANQMVTTTNTETFACSAGNFILVNMTLTANTLTGTGLNVDLLGEYPVGNLVQP